MLTKNAKTQGWFMHESCLIKARRFPLFKLYTQSSLNNELQSSTSEVIRVQFSGGGGAGKDDELRPGQVFRTSKFSFL